MFDIDNRIIQNGFHDELGYIRKRIITNCDQKFDDGIQQCAKEMEHCTTVENALNREGTSLLLPNVNSQSFRNTIEFAREQFIKLHHLERGTNDEGEDIVTPFDYLLY